MEKKEIKTRCPKCKSAFIYYKVKEEKWQCRTCGNKFGKEDVKDAF
jgi:ribosomal protein L37AE/L43A